MTIILTVISGLIIGLSLGVLGAGGAILTVPALIYVVGMSEKTAIAHSLIVVGVIALAGTIINLHRRQSQFNLRVFWMFAVSSIPGAAAGAWIGSLISSSWQISLLIILMVLAAIKMMASPASLTVSESKPSHLLMVGAATGAITGLVGVGGGFLIVPALVVFAGVTLAQATATSLALIVTNTLIAGLTLQFSDNAPQWQSSVLITLCTLGTAGVIGGQFLSGWLPADRIRRVFVFCLLVIAAVLTTDTLTKLI